MEAKFKFNIDDEVLTCFSERGIIDMCAVDSTKDIVYYVKTKLNSTWYKESQLSQLEKEDA